MAARAFHPQVAGSLAYCRLVTLDGGMHAVVTDAGAPSSGFFTDLGARCSRMGDMAPGSGDLARLSSSPSRGAGGGSGVHWDLRLAIGSQRVMRHGVDNVKHRPVGNPKRKV
jgi:hypothetical protein